VTLSFKAKATGTASLSLKSASVLLNDGNGTDALSGTSGSTIVIAQAKQTQTPPPASVEQQPAVETPVVEQPAVTAIMTPTITDYAADILEHTYLVAKGVADPNTQIQVTLASADPNMTGMKPIVTTLMSDANGNFTYVSDAKVAKGAYMFSVIAYGADGRTSAPSANVMIRARGSALFSLGVWFANLISVKVPLMLFVILLLVVIFYMSYRFKQLRKSIRKTIEDEQLHHMQH
jgi:hypothetical protein